MSEPIRRRTILAAGAAAAGLSLPGVAASAAPRRKDGVRFTLNAKVLDGGEQVTSLTLHTSQLGPIEASSLRTSTFAVHVKAKSPIPLSDADAASAEYELDRVVTDVRLDRRGNVVLELAYADLQVGGGTLGYVISKERNVLLDLDYTIEQTAPIVVRHRHRSYTIERFVQGRLSDPEVDAFSYHVSASGLNYRLFSAPRRRQPRPGKHDRGQRPLVVWLHGGGEGGLLPDGYYDNEATLRANRGALGFATPEGQRILDDAYVVAPQSTSFWIEDGPRFAPLIREVIRDVVRKHSIDRDRIYVVGCSNGGYMSLKMTTVYPDLFAASVPICGVVTSLGGDGPVLIPDDQLKEIDTPTWLVASRDDTTVPPVPNTVHASELIPDSLITLYDEVVWDGVQYPGHWSWIYVGRNDPSIKGEHIWQWMARQQR